MKKIILSLAALLTFGIASAQTDPKQPPQTPATPTTTPATPAAKKATTDANMQNEVKPEGEQPRKDELKTRDHVKSTPKTTTADKSRTKNDTVSSGKSKRKKM